MSAMVRAERTDMEVTVQLGFVGLGAMGASMAARLIDAGHDVVVFDVRAEAVESLVARGAAGAASAAELAGRTAVVLTSLPAPAVSESIVAELARGDAVKLVVELSTIGQASSVRCARMLADAGIAYLDVPVSGGVRGAEAGTLTAMAAGPTEELAAVAEALDAITANVVHVGAEPGQAQIVKLANNILSANAIVASAEAVLLAVRAGIDPRIVIEVISTSTGRNSAINDKFAQMVVPRGFDSKYRLDLITKDVRLCLDAAQELRTPMFVGRQVEELFSLAESTLGGTRDSLDVIRVLEGWAGVEIDDTSWQRTAKEEA